MLLGVVQEDASRQRPLLEGKALNEGHLQSQFAHVFARCVRKANRVACWAPGWQGPDPVEPGKPRRLRRPRVSKNEN